MLREFIESDLTAYYTLGNDPVVTRFTGTGRLVSLHHALQVLRMNPLADYRLHGFGHWACVLKESGNGVIGFAGLKFLDDLRAVDLVIWLLPAYWGHGLGTEAGAAALNYGFDCLRLKRLIGLIDPMNRASARVLEKLGMIHEGSVEYRGAQVAKYAIESVSTAADGNPSRPQPTINAIHSLRLTANATALIRRLDLWNHRVSLRIFVEFEWRKSSNTW